ELLARLVGLHERVILRLQGAADAIARFDDAQFEAHRISSVQFVRFPLDPARIAALADLSRPAEIVVDHPAYSATAALPLALRAALLEDLSCRRSSWRRCCGTTGARSPRRGGRSCGSWPTTRRIRPPRRSTTR